MSLWGIQELCFAINELLHVVPEMVHDCNQRHGLQRTRSRYVLQTAQLMRLSFPEYLVTETAAPRRALHAATFAVHFRTTST